MSTKLKWLVALVLAMSLTAAITFTAHSIKVNEQKLKAQTQKLEAQTKSQHDAEVQNLKKIIEQKDKELQSKAEAKERARIAAVEASKTPVVSKVVQSIVPTAQAATGSHTELMAAAGISPSDYQYVEAIVQKESGWRHLVVNSIGATGLCQSLPGSKMASAGADYLTNPVTQLRWCSSYAQSRYGGWANAWSAWQSKHWW
jgi:hypothetical protein